MVDRDDYYIADMDSLPDIGVELDGLVYIPGTINLSLFAVSRLRISEMT